MKRTKKFSLVFFYVFLILCVFQLLTIRPSYSAVPSITSVSPDTGTISSSTSVTIKGENFEPGAKVSLLSGGPLLAGNISGRHVSVSGNYAYVADGRSGLKVLDISILPSPEIVASIDIGFADKVYVSGNYAYVTGAGLRVIDISDPTSPKLAVSINAPGSIEDVSGDYAYLTGTSVMTEQSWLTVVNISNPILPEITSSYDISGNAYGVYVSGSYVYVAVAPGCCGYFAGAGLQVLDISDPAVPVTVGFYDTPGNAFDVYVSGNYAYVAAGQAGLQIIDISDPTSPAFVGSFVTLGSTIQNTDVSGSSDWITGSVYGVYLADDYAYLVGETGLLVIDISDPTSPALVASHDIRGVASNVYVTGDYAYVTDKEGLLLVDVSNPVTPAFAGTAQTRGEALSVHLAGDYAYVSAWSKEEFHGFLNLSVINISNPKSTKITSSFRDSFFIPSPWSSAYSDVYLSEDYAYVTVGQAGLQMIDISDSTSPALIGSFFPKTTSNYILYKAGNVYVSGNYAYVPFLEDDGWESRAWLWIFDISAPQAPTLTSSIRMPSETIGVYVSGSLAYLASGKNGLVVIDINDPAEPFLIGSYDTPGTAKDVYISGSYAYIADGESGLSVMDISDPTAPFLVGNYDTPGTARRLHVSGNYAYLADGAAGLTVINISDPISPFLADLVDTPHITNDVYASGGYAYLANGHSGLIVTATHDVVTDVNVVNSTRITATFPSGLPKGPYHILVTNPGGQTEEAYLYNSFKAGLFSAPKPKHKCCMKHHRKGRNREKGHKEKNTNE